MENAPSHLALLISYWFYFVMLATACVVHVMAMRWAPTRGWALYHSTVATISAIFAALVLWLISGRDIDLRIWVTLTIQAFVYPCVWILPGVLSIIRGHREHAAVHELVKAVKRADEITTDLTEQLVQAVDDSTPRGNDDER